MATEPYWKTHVRARRGTALVQLPEVRSAEMLAP